MTDGEKLTDFLSRWIHVPHWKGCWKIDCERCEEEYVRITNSYKPKEPVLQSPIKDCEGSTDS